MNRVYVAEGERKDFYLYVDEFQNFATNSFIKILSEARKYRLDLTLANQYIGQIDEEVQKRYLVMPGRLCRLVLEQPTRGFFQKNLVSGIQKKN